jgi:G3E family GTPase
MVRPTLTQPRGSAIPLTVVAGASGAGKASLARRFLLGEHGRPVAVVLGEPGGMPVDSERVDAWLDYGLRLRNGNLCVGIDGDVERGLQTLATGGAGVHHVVVAAPSGVSLLRASGYAYMPGFSPCGRVLMLAAHDLARAIVERNTYELSAVTAQLRQADLCAINHVDRVARSVVTQLRAFIESVPTRARVIECERVGIPAALLLGTEPACAPTHATFDSWSPDFVVESVARRWWSTQPRHDDDYRAWVLSMPEAVDAAQFRAWVDALPPTILRGEGMVRLRHDPGRESIFRLCGARWWLTPRVLPADRREAGGWLTLVGLGATRPLRRGAGGAPDQLAPDAVTGAATGPLELTR